MMEFHVTPVHVQRESRKTLFLVAFLGLAGSGLLLNAWPVEKLTDLALPIFGVTTLVWVGWPLLLRIKEGVDGYPTLNLDESAATLEVSHKDVRVIVELSKIKQLRLQAKSGRLVSILLKTASGEDLRFAGYENLEVLAAALERLAPQENITRASFYHH